MSNILKDLDYLSETKEKIRQAIIQKGVPVSEEDTFRSYADKILQIYSQSSELTELQIEAINSMLVNLDYDLYLEYDESVLDLDFTIDKLNLVVNNNMTGLDFNINENGELEAIY